MVSEEDPYFTSDQKVKPEAEKRLDSPDGGTVGTPLCLVKSSGLLFNEASLYKTHVSQSVS